MSKSYAAGAALGIFLTGVAVLGPGPGYASAAPPPAGAQVRFVESSGTGCPRPGDVTATDSNNGQVLSLIYNALMVQPVQGSDAKACLVVMEVSAPAGHTFAPAYWITAGYSDVPDGQSATLTERVALGRPEGGQVLTTPMNTNGRPWRAKHHLDSREWAPCAAKTKLHLHSTVAATAAVEVPPPFLQVDIVNFGVDGLEWRAC